MRPNFTKALAYGLTGIFLFVLLGCEKEAPVKPDLQIPTVQIWQVPEILYLEEKEPELLQVIVTDPQGKETVKDVEVSFLQQGQPVFQSDLRDDGTNGDIIPNNGTYSFQFVPADLGLAVGELILRFQAEDLDGNRSEPVEDTLEVKLVKENHPPVIIEVVGPDTISRSSGQSYLLTATVEDPEGLNDIQSVLLNSFHPDGRPASGNPFSFYDSGQNGDAVAGDGIYSFQFSISPNNTLGTYRFEIQARDRSGALSNKVIHLITVIE